MSSLGTFWLPLFGGAQKLNIRSAPLIGGSGRIRFRILSFVSDFKVLARVVVAKLNFTHWRKLRDNLNFKDNHCFKLSSMVKVKGCPYFRYRHW